LAKKQEKKAEEERKKAELLRKKAEAKALLEQEEKSIKTTAKLPMSKITRAEIEKEVEKRNQNIHNINHPSSTTKVVNKVAPIEENLNRVLGDTHFASGIDEAIKVLKVEDTAEDRHPEKRMKAAYKAYEEAEMPVLKAQNPTLKLSQLKQMIFKNWQKSPENPLNQ
jgi:Coiled-coil domain-containing protein 124 /Oxs1